MLPGHRLHDWNLLSDDAQLRLAHEAMHRAAKNIAAYAELLAGQIEAGEIADRGGPEALRLLATMVCLTGGDSLTSAGTA